MPIVRKVFRMVFRSPQILLGCIICKIPFFSKYKHYLLSSWHDFDKRNFVDNFLFPYTYEAWIRFEYLKERDPDKREELKSMVMGGNSGKNWAKYYDSLPLDFDSKIGHLPFYEAVPIFKEVENICQKSQNMVVVQVGSSSGREMAYFAAKFPKFKFIGIDIYQDVIDYSKKAHRLPNLSFEVISAKNISQLIFPPQRNDILILDSGSLQFVQPEHLRDFFRSIASCPNLWVVINAAANESHGNPAELKRSIWRGNLSYTHDYKFYAEEYGMKTLKCEIIKPYVPYKDFPEQKGTVHYFYVGRSDAKE